MLNVSALSEEYFMVITLSPELEIALNEAGRKQGMAPEAIAIDALRERFLGPVSTLQPQDEWEKGLLEAARPWGGFPFQCHGQQRRTLRLMAILLDTSIFGAFGQCQ